MFIKRFQMLKNPCRLFGIGWTKYMLINDGRESKSPRNIAGAFTEESRRC